MRSGYLQHGHSVSYLSGPLLSTFIVSSSVTLNRAQIQVTARAKTEGGAKTMGGAWMVDIQSYWIMPLSTRLEYTLLYGEIIPQ